MTSIMDFYESKGGRDFIDRTIPQLAINIDLLSRSMDRLAQAIEKQNKIMLEQQQHWSASAGGPDDLRSVVREFCKTPNPGTDPVGG